MSTPLVSVGLGYVDQYLCGAAEMHLHIGWIDRRYPGSLHSNGGGVLDYCIVLQKMRAFAEVIPTYGAGNNKGNVVTAATKQDKLTVLVCVFEAAEHSQVLSPNGQALIPRLVRLQRYDQCPSIGTQPLDGVLEPLTAFGVTDHEVSVVSLSEDVLTLDWETRIVSALFGGAGDHNMVKRTSQVMYEISQHDGDHGVRLFGDLEAVPDFLLAIRQPDARGLVRVAACVPQGFLLDVYHVLFSTLDLEPPVVHNSSI